MDKEEILRLIKVSQSDVRHILNTSKPFKGIKKVLIAWLMTFIVSNVATRLFTALSVHFYLYGTNIYFIIKDFLNLMTIVLPIGMYIYKYKTVEMTQKEKDYLKSFFLFPVLYIFCVCLPGILDLIDPYFRFQAIYSFPFSHFVTIMALYHLNGYFKNKYLFIVFLCFVAYLVLYLLFEVYIVLDEFKLLPLWIIRIDYLIQDINSAFLIDSLFLMISFLLLTHKYIDKNQDS